MAQPSTSNPSSEDVYESRIISGTHGEQYQTNLALLMFERATRRGHDFKLATEMEIADKFDDVVFFNGPTGEWTLIQVKHTDTSKGKPSPLTFEMLFPLLEDARKKGDFSIYKYLKSYMNVKNNFQKKANLVIFTNRLLDNNLSKFVELEPRQMDDILCLGTKVGLKITDHKLIEQMLENVNRDFNSLKNSIVNLFDNKIMDKGITNFKTPLASVLTNANNIVKFSDDPPPEANELLESLKKYIDIRTAQVPLNICKDIFSGRSRIKTFPLLANEDTINQFFQDLNLYVGQPDDLRSIIDEDLRAWMRTWIRPDYFGRLEESQLQMITVNLESFFVGNQSLVQLSNASSHKKMLLLQNGQQFFNSAERELKNQFNYFVSSNDATDYYINRRIEFTDEVNKTAENDDRSTQIKIHDYDFAHELTGKLKKYRFLFLIAEPGMGKSTVLQFIALDAQRKTNDCVHLFYLNTFNQKLDQIDETDTDDKLLSVLRTGLSQSNFDSLRKTIVEKNSKKAHLLLFDALDEVSPENREKILKIFRLLLDVPNVKFFVSARRTVKSLVEKAFKTQTFSLIPFSKQDQIDFLQKLWNVSEQNKIRLVEYVDHLFKTLHSGVNRAVCEFIGIPLMMRMLADVHDDRFNKYLKLGESKDMMSREQLNIISLYEAFVRKCFDNKMIKSYGNASKNEDYDTLYEKFILEHELLAIKTLHIYGKDTIFEDDNHKKILHEFEERIKKGTHKSPLIEATDSTISFIHLSYAEFLVANFLIINFEKYEFLIFGFKSKTGVLTGYSMSMIKQFLLVMIEIEQKPTHLKILAKHFKKNKDIALWACEVDGHQTVDYLLRDNYDSEIINRLFGVSAKHNSYNICSDLLEKHHVEVDYKVDKAGRTILHVAASKGHSKVVQILINHNANVNAKDGFAYTPLHYAAENCNLEIVKCLTEQSADVNTTGSDGWTPLYYAAQNGDLEIVKYLIEHIANVNAKNIDGWTPLHYAAQNGHLEIVNYLIEHSAEVNTKDSVDQTPLHFAAQNFHWNVVKILTDHSADVNAKTQNGWTALHYATEYGSLEVVKFLTMQSADVNIKNSDDKTPLHYAAQNGDLEIVKYLIERIANVNAKNIDGWTPLHYAAQNGYLELVICLTKQSADVNTKDNEGWTPLHYATARGNLKIVEILTEHSTDVNAKTQNGWTALHYATKYGSLEVAKFLTMQSADVNIKNSDGKTPLHYAAQNGYLELVKCLTEQSADVNTKDNKGWTPLHYAASNGNLKIVKLLTEHSADVEAKTKNGDTPYLIATRCDHLAVAQYIDGLIKTDLE